MKMDEAIKLVQEHGKAAIRCYQITNEPGRASGKVAMERERKATWKLLVALTDSLPTVEEVERATE